MPALDSRLISTVSLAVNYLAGAPTGTVKATGHVTGGGRSITFASAELTAADGTRIGTAQGSFKLPTPPA